MNIHNFILTYFFPFCLFVFVKYLQHRLLDISVISLVSFNFAKVLTSSFIHTSFLLFMTK